MKITLQGNNEGEISIVQAINGDKDNVITSTKGNTTSKLIGTDGLFFWANSATRKARSFTARSAAIKTELIGGSLVESTPFTDYLENH